MKKQRMTKRIWVVCLCMAVLSPMTLSAGIHAGYRFTPVRSLEMTANWG